MSTVVMIPARLAASRLPNKPLLPIQGIPMIVRVLQQAEKADIGPVYVACDGPDIEKIVLEAGGRAILTDPALPSGSDRIAAALSKITEEYDYIINLQGDLPFIEPHYLTHVLEPLHNQEFDMATLGTPIHKDEQWQWPQLVKVIAETNTSHMLEAVDFVRSDPQDKRSQAYHHIGIYAYKSAALRRFVNAPPSSLEKDRKLEQMRALEMGMRIGLTLVDCEPLSVDTPEDYQRAQDYQL